MSNSQIEISILSKIAKVFESEYNDILTNPLNPPKIIIDNRLFSKVLYRPEENEIVINLKRHCLHGNLNETALMSTISHELCHYFQFISETDYFEIERSRIEQHSAEILLYSVLPLGPGYLLLNDQINEFVGAVFFLLFLVIAFNLNIQILYKESTLEQQANQFEEMAESIDLQEMINSILNFKT